MLSNPPAIIVSGVGKTFPVYDKPYQRLLRAMPRLVHRVLRVPQEALGREYTALNNLSFAIERGQTVGIIGRNGAGKSTLLQIISGTLSPSEGVVSVNGKVAALLELGAGFNPEFTGRENIRLNAAIFGLTSAQIENRMADIEAFADIGDFIDRPVRTYSSGMYVRLAFSVIAHVDADILIVDEALSVGDVYFQQKCMRFLRAFQSSGGTILFVSHDIGSVTGLCKKALYLSRANIGEYSFGDSETVCRQYLGAVYKEKSALQSQSAVRFLESESDQAIDGEPVSESIVSIGSFRAGSESFGQGGGEIIDAWFQDDKGHRIHTFKGGDSISLIIECTVVHDVLSPAIGLMLKDRLGQYIFAESSDVYFRSNRPSLKKRDRLLAEFKFRMPELISGEYAVSLAFADGVGDDHTQLHWLHDALSITIVRSRLVHGICGLPDLSLRLHVSRNKERIGNVDAS